MAERAVWVEPERDGMATLVCHLPAVSVFAIDDTLDQHARSLAGAEEPRTHAQLRADTLTDLLLDPHSRDARVKGVRANVTITVPALTLLGHSDEPAELIGYGPIDVDTARRLTATAPSVTRLLTDLVTGARLTVGRNRYTVPADLRAAVQLDDETCRFPGCVRRADRCDLDHTIDWANNGHTSLDNLAALCRCHHTVKHHTDWTVTQGPNRTLHWTSPSGARHTTTPAKHSPPTSAPPIGARGPALSDAPHPQPPGDVAHSSLTSRPPRTRPLPDDPPF
ncbi:HNH endonuclease [Herbiconiux sp. CPCC 203386]|uniref:HNH endonuclease n=1 Tax=Herbiconiux daphne TaxID=2970914 RepID=A0ABT2H5E9_9MICO|nr:HNH endonuclease [Herbiconiux daphne]